MAWNGKTFPAYPSLIPKKENPMKAIICEQPGQFKIKEMDSPTPGAGEALVRMRRIGICGTDLHAYKGRHPLVTYPRILGHELSGEVAAIREPAHGLKVGDPVVILPYLECGKCIARLPPGENQLLYEPEGLRSPSGWGHGGIHERAHGPPD
jgi:threonine dehydrogenase-like Zn-dependent dehydrogenase